MNFHNLVPSNYHQTVGCYENIKSAEVSSSLPIPLMNHNGQTFDWRKRIKNRMYRGTGRCVCLIMKNEEGPKLKLWKRNEIKVS
jgi:hypothetical protein